MEILTLLDPSTVDATASHSTDNSGLTAALVSGAMAGSNAIGISILKNSLNAYMFPDDGVNKLIKFVDDEAKIRNWKYENKKTLIMLARLCLIEYACEAKCKPCKGTGFIDHKECEKCNGTGESEYTMLSRAQYLGISRNTYYKRWEKRRSHIAALFFDMLPGYGSSAKRHIRKLLKNNTIED